MKNRHTDKKVVRIQAHFGLDFKIMCFRDFTIQSMRLVDNWGYFLPVSFDTWERLVERTYQPQMQALYPRLHPQVAFDQAIIHYCREYQHLYICNN